MRQHVLKSGDKHEVRGSLNVGADWPFAAGERNLRITAQHRGGDGEEAIKTSSKSRWYFLKSPASVATHGIDCESTPAEWMPMSLSAAEIDCDTANKRKMALVDAIAERARRRTLNRQVMVSLPRVF